MVCQELKTMTLAVFHNELRVAMTSYYEDILKMPGASDVPNKVSYKRPLKRIADGGIDVQEPPPATEAAAAPAAPDAAPTAPAASAASAEAADPLAEAAVSPVKEKPAKAGRGAKRQW